MSDATEAPPKAKRLTPVQAAALFKKVKPLHDELKRDLDAARAALLEHFHETGDSEYRGIVYALTWQNRLDTAKAREALGPAAAAACEKPTKRETLTIVRS